ncbi:MAG TPA: hypothetical protein VEB43_04885 [Anaeromyxobacter sp.]|nr:hypothetical protein [Anaeromyxobacter sp.]
MSAPRLVRAALGALLLASGCESVPRVVVDALDDGAPADDDVTTLREAVAATRPGVPITFDPALDGGTITLTIVGAPHTTLPGEVYAGGPPTYQGYQDRDYGPSALFAEKDLTLDASALPNGVTIRWGGGEEVPARVLAVRGDLVLRNVTVAGGFSRAEPRDDPAQPYTLARGGGLAVWGTARLDGCTVTGNRIEGDATASRDRGAYGGGIYANGLDLVDTVVAGNAAAGYGAAGGGIYSVGGATHRGGSGNDTRLTRCAVSGNRVTGQHAYGGGIFTLSGGPENVATMTLTGCTVARNVVEDHPDLPQVGQWYHRGGGIYMGGGSLALVSTTIAENAITGTPAVFGGKPNMGGGGLAATIGDAHVVEDVSIRQSIVAGNTSNGAAEDWFTGSLLFLTSEGYNLVGRLDAGHVLVPVPDWGMLSRKHWPKTGDRDGVAPAEALDLANAARHPTARSAGTDAGEAAVVWYPPGAAAHDRVPGRGYEVRHVRAGATGFGRSTDDLLVHVLAKVRAEYGGIVGTDFGQGLGDLTGVTWFGPSRTWPSNPDNQAWIAAWRAIEAELAGRLGAVGLGDDFWGRFQTGPLSAHVSVTVVRDVRRYTPSGTPDQSGGARPAGAAGDIGAIER